MPRTQVIVLNGGSSAGTTTVARALQAVLPDPWLTFGVDTFVDALPPSLRDDPGGDGVSFGSGGEVVVGPEFRTLEDAWIAGVAAMARAGARIVVDEVFLGGAGSQRRWQRALDGVSVLWVGVRCDAAEAARREATRADRVTGMAATQAELVHRGVTYDLEVDTTSTGATECARTIAARCRG